jgi:hypothetical protein
MIRLAYLMWIPVSPLEQYEKLICEPLKGLQLTNKIVIVIDALDECDDRQEILKALSRNELPSEMRVIVTTRPEYDIMSILESHPHVQRRHLRLDEPGIGDDILMYFTSQFGHAGASLGTKEIGELTRRADGLFQWASTAYRYITNQSSGTVTRRAGTNERRRYETILSGDDKLDGLYRVILQGVFSSDTEEREPVLAALATILATSVPLPISTLKELCTTDEERDAMDRDIPLLGSVFDIRPHSPIRPLHTSFRDYLTDRKRSKEFFVDLTRGHQHLAFSVFVKMTRELHFNMFNVQTSHKDFTTLFGDEPHPLLNPVSALYYSCRYWIDHIRPLDELCTSHIKEQVRTFMTKKLLFWLEVISAAKCLHIAALGLEEVKSSPLVRICSKSFI